MKTTFAAISILVTLVASSSSFAATSPKADTTNRQTKHATVQTLPADSISIVPPAIENPVFSQIPDVAHLGVNNLRF